jgi:D-glycero-D-manno-heptose 1,7-bisphosphate phosphatase
MGVGTLNRAVFLDRDGVVNQAVVRDGKPYPPSSAEELRLVDGAEECLPRLREAGFVLLVVTNQPDLARGTQTPAEVEAIHGRIRAALPIAAFYVCPHDSGDGCDCRKPRPGLIHRASAEHQIDLSRSYMIGDRWRDMDAAESAGVTGVFINYEYAERGPSAPPAAVVTSLREAVQWIWSREESR